LQSVWVCDPSVGNPDCYLTLCKVSIQDAIALRLLTRLRNVVSPRSTRSYPTVSVSRTRCHSLCAAAPANAASAFHPCRTGPCVCLSPRPIKILSLDPHALFLHSRSPWSGPKAQRVPAAIKFSGRLACRSSSSARSGSISTGIMRAGPSVTIQPVGIVRV